MARSAAALILLFGLLSACSTAAPATSVPSSGTPTDGGPTAVTPSDSPVTDAPATDAPATDAPATDAPGTGPAPSFIPDQPLEDAFPDELGGQPLPVQSATGQGIFAFLPNSDPAEVTDFVGQFGATIDDVSAASTFLLIPGATATDITGISMLALRVRGADGTELRDAFAELVLEDAPGSSIQEGTVAGKDVLLISDPENDPDEVVHLYALGDVAFLIGGTQSLVEEALTKLP